MTTKPEILSFIEEDNKHIQRLKLEIKHKKQMLALLERQEQEKGKLETLKQKEE